MIFNLLSREQKVPSEAVNQVFLMIDNWNDFSFVTMFYVWVFDERGVKHELGNVKIGFFDQTKLVSTYSTLPTQFEELSESYFSLGTDVDYYRQLSENISENFRSAYLSAINDMAFDLSILDRASGQDVLKTSLLRDVSIASVKEQFPRILDGGLPLTDFNFTYQRSQEEKFAGIEISFDVTANSKPSTNIHAVIGRNGVGKTTLLNGMINAITEPELSAGQFLCRGPFQTVKIQNNYFSSLVSISFSAFDPFIPPPEQNDPEKGTQYYYIGLKELEDETGTLLKSLSCLHEEFIASLLQCLNGSGSRSRWLAAMSTLESDVNFSEMNLTDLADRSGEDLKRVALNRIKRMSSGHAVVLLTLTRLVAKVEEKTLVLLDEPESHLHPPLLSAFTRALSELLFNRNGVAIIATHSPVVLQEVPSSCVWKLTRTKLAQSAIRPDIETFGENVGILTREIFGLEVSNSGYHTLLAEAVSTGASHEDIVAQFQDCLGFEARAILRAMIVERDSGVVST